MKKITYWSILTNTDSTEGRGAMVDTGIAFSTKEDAVAFAQSERYKKFAVMGVVNPQYSKYNIQEKQIFLYDDIHDYDVNHKEIEKEKTRATALNKLTDEERKALGF